MIKKYPNGVTLVINPNQLAVATKRRRVQDPVDWSRNRLWFVCPACLHAYDRPFKSGCYCMQDADGSYVATPLKRLQTEDQEAAEAAFRLGGVQAVLDMVREKYLAER